MTGYLLDSNIALRATALSASLTPRVRRAIERGPNYISVVSYWEILLKSMKGKLRIGDPRLWWSNTIDQLAATALALKVEHVSAIGVLPAIHQDPFDRALIAQAQVEGMTLVTTDAALSAYSGKLLRVVE